MGSIHFVGGEKGGVGKSFTARLLAQYFIDHEQPFHGYDSDRSHGSFTRFYDQYTQPVDPTSFASLDHMVAYAEDHPNHHIIVDLAAQTDAPLQTWLAESDMVALFNELGFQVVLWHVMDDGADSLYLLGKTLHRAHAQALKLVVVENQGRGSDFAMTEHSEVFTQAKERGATVFTLAALEPTLAKKVDFSNASFWAAANNRQIMSTVERHRVRAWLNKHYAQLDAILAASPEPVLKEPVLETQTQEQPELT